MYGQRTCVLECGIQCFLLCDHMHIHAHDDSGQGARKERAWIHALGARPKRKQHDGADVMQHASSMDAYRAGFHPFYLSVARSSGPGPAETDPEAPETDPEGSVEASGSK